MIKTADDYFYDSCSGNIGMMRVLDDGFVEIFASGIPKDLVKQITQIDDVGKRFLAVFYWYQQFNEIEI